MIKIGDKVDISNGYAFKSSKYVEQGIRVVRITNVQKGEIQDDNPKFYSSDTKEELKSYLINEGDILMSLTGNVGRVGVFPKEYCPAYLNQRVARIRVKSQDLFQKYLFYMLNSEFFERDAIFNSSGIAQLNLSTKWVSEYKIPLPPLDQQKKIAAILDAADAYRQKTKALIEKYDELTQSLFLEMFGDPVANYKGLPKIKLGDLGKWQSGGTPSRKNSAYFEGDIPWLSSGELEEMYISDSKEHISQEAVNESAAKIVENGSLLLGMYDTAALKSTISDAPLTCNQAIAFCRLNDSKVNTIYVYKIIQIGKEHYRRLQRGVRQKNLNLSMVKEIEILYPSLELQNQFAERVQAIEAQKAQAQASLTQAEDLFNSLLQRAFKGELTA